MRALRWIATIVASCLIITLLIGVIAPRNAKIEGRTTINVPVDIVFGQINDLSTWQRWFPFEDADTTVEIQAHGPSSGVGAQMLWQSEKYGSGMAIITGVKQNKWITMSIDLFGDKIMTSRWTFEQEGLQTKVTWTIDVDGLSYPIGRIQGLFYNSNMQPYFNNCFINLDNICRAIADSTQSKQQTRKK